MRASNERILNATKWSTITEIFAKLLVPITNIILARLLAPEAYGVVATVTMVINFAEIFSDSGFQKYLIQHEFKNEKEQEYHTQIAFWTNMSVAIICWVLISIFSNPIARIVGSDGYGSLIIVAGCSLPLLAFSSIQMAVLRREFEYKKLFKVRLVSIIIPFIITIPLAIAGWSYWALIIGTVCGNIGIVFALFAFTKWKPKLIYSFSILREMFSFSLWSIVEAFTVWLTNWADIFIVGKTLSSYYLGIYKTAPSTIGGVIGIVTSATTSILFATLSRLQDDEEEYRKSFLQFQKIVALLVIPMGVGIFVYREFVTSVLLGSQWTEAVLLMGLWGLTSSFIVIYSNYPSEVYRSKGKPMYSAIVQIGHIVALIPACLIAVKYDFRTLVIARSMARIELIILQLFVLRVFFKFPVIQMIRQNVSVIICAVLMGVFGFYVRQLFNNTVWEIASIVLCVFVYFLLLLCFKDSRSDLLIAKALLQKKRNG